MAHTPAQSTMSASLRVKQAVNLSAKQLPFSSLVADAFLYAQMTSGEQKKMTNDEKAKACLNPDPGKVNG